VPSLPQSKNPNTNTNLEKVIMINAGTMGKSKSKKKPEGKVPNEAQGMLWNVNQGNKQDPLISSLEMAIMQDNQGNKKMGSASVF
jgi:hypothetical protein